MPVYYFCSLSKCHLSLSVRYEQTVGVAALSLAVFFRLIAAGQSALIQGMRRIADLARIGVLTLFSTVIAHSAGLLAERTRNRAVTCGCRRGINNDFLVVQPKNEIHKSSIAVFELSREAAAILRLGFAFMSSAFLTMGAAYAIRIMRIRKGGFEAAGLYHPRGHSAACTLDLFCRQWAPTFTRA